MIRMRINNDTDSMCRECGLDWSHTKEMYDIQLFGQRSAICKRCADVLFRKLLSASCAYDGKVKTKEDKERARKEARALEGD